MKISRRPTLIIGYGNPLRGDDAFGWHAAHRLIALAQGKSVRVLPAHQLTPELAEPISDAELVIFIDASHQGEPGAWQCKDIARNVLLASDCSSAHYLTPVALLVFARTVYGACPRALLFSFTTESFGCGETLTRSAKAALPEVLQRILAIL